MFGFFGNIVALVMFVRDNQFRSTVDMLLINLAFADIGMCGLCFPFVSASNFAQVRFWTSELLKLPSFFLNKKPCLSVLIDYLCNPPYQSLN